MSSRGFSPMRRVAAWLELARLRVQPAADPALNRLPDADKADEHRGFLADSDYAILQQEPLRAKVLVKAIAFVFVVFVVWAAYSQVDEVTRGEGKVIPSRQLQIVQSLDGGVVEEILVREGDVVNPEQILLKIDQTRFASSVRESRVQQIALLAKAARLKALAENTEFKVLPELEKEDPKTVDEERRLFESRRTEHANQVSISRQQMAQRQQELVEVRAKYEQASKAYDYSVKELAVTKPLAATGAVSEVELLRLERDTARYRGEREMTSAQIPRIQAAIAESSRKIDEVGFVFRNEAGKELAETMSRLNSLTEGGVGLSDKVARAVLRSPVKGTVKRLLINTVGGVVQPGKDVVEIVPLEDTLVLEARVLPRDIAFLGPGQKVVVKFTAYDFSIYGGLDGKLEHIGADTVVDEKGNAFYTVRVRTSKTSLGDNLPIIPGMVAEVDIVTGKKSVLSYLMKPVLRAKAVAFTER